MKKKAIQKRTVKNKWKKRLGLVSLLGLVLISAVFISDSVQEKEEVSAHPTNPISIGSGSKLFEVPIDGGEHLEYSSSYSAYRQLNTSIPSLGKQLSETEDAETKLFSSRIYNDILSSYVTSNGNIISMQRFNNDKSDLNRINQTRIILQSPTGEVLDTEWVYATPNVITQPSGNKEVSNNSFFQKSGTEFMLLYTTRANLINTTTFIDEGNSLSVSQSDNNGPVNTSGINMKGQGIHGGFVSNSGSIISIPSIYPASTYKTHYITVEHNNGQSLGVIEFEASPEAMNVSGDPKLSSAALVSMVPIDNQTYIGVERIISATLGNSYSICKWVVDPITRKASRTEIVRYPGLTVEFVRNISDTNRLFAQVKSNNTPVNLISVDTSSLSVKLCNTFPKETNLNFTKQGSGYFYAGQINHLTGEFQNIGTTAGFYSG